MMVTNGVTSRGSAAPRRRYHYVSGLFLRMLVALAIAWVVVMAFFATAVVSH